ncbi:DUF2303 family protein [Pelistega ratti]|uniref:DUF2303 family protein n=1 Tax=Pelistega ratti TaxID=2652177 RepID=UPI001356C2D1|nr:DUF2303 family protein [Pelistega ratti]
MDNYLNETGDTENIVQTLSKKLAQPVKLETALPNSFVSVFAIPKGYDLVSDASSEQYQPAPYRAKGNVHFVDVDSFIEYVNLYKTPETRLYAKVDPQNTEQPLLIKAVFNEHVPHALAGWRDFTATLTMLPSYEWKLWNYHHKEAQSQFDFAVFIEENIKDIHHSEDRKTPTGTDMLKLALDFEIKQDKSIKSIVRTQSGGTKLDFVDMENQATVEQMQAFNEFAIGIPVFFHGKGYEIFARLRYRQSQAKLTIWYELIRPDLVVDAAVTAVLTTIKEKVSINPLYIA